MEDVMVSLRAYFVLFCALAWVIGCSKKEQSGPMIKGEEVTYEQDSITFKGYLVTDHASKEKRPGVLVVHEWWGQNSYARKRAEMLAELGYNALAVDMYGDGKTAAHPEDAGKFAGAVFKNMESAKARFMAAMKLLQDQETTESENIAAIGYCFGGGVVLHMARMGVDLKAVVSFHGSLATAMPAKEGQVKAMVLACHGADDPFVKKEDIENFKKEMDAAKVNYKFVAYEGAVHSFTNPDADSTGAKFNLPLKYNHKADESSWAEMQSLFKKAFAQKKEAAY